MLWISFRFEIVFRSEIVAVGLLGICYRNLSDMTHWMMIITEKFKSKGRKVLKCLCIPLDLQVNVFQTISSFLTILSLHNVQCGTFGVHSSWWCGTLSLWFKKRKKEEKHMILCLCFLKICEWSFYKHSRANEGEDFCQLHKKIESGVKRSHCW